MNWRRFFYREQVDADQQQELDSYLEITTDDYIARGMEPEAARMAARRKLGNTTLLREEVYDMNTISLFDSLSAAFRYWLRTVRREPLFAATAILLLALGIGATTAIFSVVNGVLIQPLTYPNARQLLAIAHHTPGWDFGGEVGMSPSMLFTYREENRVFQSIGGWSPAAATVTGIAEPERTRMLLVTFGFLQTMDVPPLLGRWVSVEDDTPGAPEVVLLSYGYWQRRFGSDRGVLGRGITVDSRPRRIVGVMPPSFFTIMGQDPDLFVPLRLDRAQLHLGDLGFLGIARLKPGISLGEANSDVARMLPVWLRSWPAPNASLAKTFASARFAAALHPLKDQVVGDVGSVLWMVLGAVGLVLLIACANVANLMLVKTESRQQELGIRIALGAGRPRILCDTLAESLLLGTLGGLLGLTLAYLGLRLLRFMARGNLPRLHEISIDSSVLLFALAVSLFSCLLLGLFPAWKYAGSPAASALRTGGRFVGTGRQRHRARNLLVVGQVSLALVLLVVSGLMIRTFQEIRRVQPGFTGPEQVQVFKLAIPKPPADQPERAIQMHKDILEKLATIPGVSAVGLTNSLPMDYAKNQNPIIAENIRYEPGQNPPVRTFKFVSPGLLAATGTRLLAGRDLSWADIESHRPVAMVSENLAVELWGSPAAALGKRIREQSVTPHWREVVGVAENVRDDGVRNQSPKTVYWPFAVENFSGATLRVERNVAFAIRCPGAGTEGFSKQVRRVVASVSPDSPLTGVRTLQQLYEESMANTSFALVMLAIAGSMALLISVIGVYGVVAYTVAERRREVGIRIALGASGRAVTRMVLRQGLLLTGLGIALGLAAASGLSRLMSSMLFGVAPLDPVTYSATGAVLLIAAMAATYIPARRAASVDPMDTLRGE